MFEFWVGCKTISDSGDGAETDAGLVLVSSPCWWIPIESFGIIWIGKDSNAWNGGVFSTTVFIMYYKKKKQKTTVKGYLLIVGE